MRYSNGLLNHVIRSFETEKSVWRVQCSDFGCYVVRWLLYLIIIEPKLFNILKIFKSFQFADSVGSQIECSDAGILVQIFQNLNTVVGNVQLLQGWQLLQVLELKLVGKVSGRPRQKFWVKISDPIKWGSEIWPFKNWKKKLENGKF